MCLFIHIKQYTHLFCLCIPCIIYCISTHKIVEPKSNKGPRASRLGWNPTMYDVEKSEEVTLRSAVDGLGNLPAGGTMGIHPWKINMELGTCGFGRSCSFLNGWFVGFMLIFQGVIPSISYSSTSHCCWDVGLWKRWFQGIPTWYLPKLQIKTLKLTGDMAGRLDVSSGLPPKSPTSNE